MGLAVLSAVFYIAQSGIVKFVREFEFPEEDEETVELEDDE